MTNALEMFLAAGGYIKRHPEEAVRAVRNATALRFGVPVDALRWFAGRIRGRKAPKDVMVSTVPPGLRADATVNLMGTSVRAGATVFIDEVALSPEEIRLELRVQEVKLDVQGDGGGDSPIGALLKSGALDLSKPGNLVAYMPKRPDFLVDASDDRITLDLMKHPKIGGNPVVRAVVAAVTPTLTVQGIQTDAEHLDVILEFSPSGVSESMAAAMEAVRAAPAV